MFDDLYEIQDNDLGCQLQVIPGKNLIYQIICKDIIYQSGRCGSDPCILEEAILL